MNRFLLYALVVLILSVGSSWARMLGGTTSTGGSSWSSNIGSGSYGGSGGGGHK